MMMMMMMMMMTSPMLRRFAVSLYCYWSKQHRHRMGIHSPLPRQAASTTWHRPESNVAFKLGCQAYRSV